MRATGQVSAQGHGLTSWPLARVAAKARSSRICASSALAWIQAPWPRRTAPSSARMAAAAEGKRDGRRNVDAGGWGSVDIVSSARPSDREAAKHEDEKAH